VTSKRATVLVVDDEQSITDLLSEYLMEAGLNCITVATGEDALKRLSMNNINAMLLDLRLPGISGMDVLKEAVSTHPEVAVIVVTSVRDAQTAVEAMKIGAFDYITKPFELQRVNSSIVAALKENALSLHRSRTGDEGRHAQPVWARYLNDIAEGVETRLDSLTGHVMTTAVIENTIEIARSLGIPESRIDNWANARRTRIAQFRTIDDIKEGVMRWLAA
jgi:DNA-binding response OmpR family regulator